MTVVKKGQLRFLEKSLNCGNACRSSRELQGSGLYESTPMLQRDLSHPQSCKQTLTYFLYMTLICSLVHQAGYEITLRFSIRKNRQFLTFPWEKYHTTMKLSVMGRALQWWQLFEDHSHSWSCNHIPPRYFLKKI